MSEQNRVTLTGGLWVVSAVVLAALYISAAAQGELTQSHIFLTFVILACAFGGTVFVMRWKGGEQQEKAKRRIDNLIGDMSDEELIELKRRLSDVGLDDDAAEDVDTGKARRRG